MTELEAAQQIAAGALPSPYTHMNMTLFAVRVTGSGMAYRSSLNEYVWRDPAIFLSDEFIQRVSGLPLVWEHPGKGSLSSEEFSDRVIGALMFGYRKDDEIWGIARVYDDEAIQLMTDGQLSTSPGVIFAPTDGNVTTEVKGGKVLLVEGRPQTLCHLAVLAEGRAGVWDKGGPRDGVQNDLIHTQPVTKDMTSMPEDDKAAADAARRDADAGAKLDKLLTHLDSISARMDAFEEEKKADKARKDADDEAKADAARKDAQARRDAEREEWKKADAAMCDSDDEAEAMDAAEFEKKGDPKDVAADKARSARKDRMDARKDAAEKEESMKKEEEAKADAARADAQGAAGELAALRREMAALKELVRPLPETDRAAFADEQARADSVYRALGSEAPGPMGGEKLAAYQIRLARGLQKHSKQWTGIELHKLEPAAFAIAAQQIRNDAEVYARAPDDIEPGQLREINSVDRTTGQRMTTFVGKGTFIGQMKRPSRRVVGINTKF